MFFGFITSADGSERQLKGYKRSKPNDNHPTYDKSNTELDRLPAKVDLRPYMSAVENQGDTNSCTANATAGAYEYLLKRYADEEKDVSRLFIYYNARYLDESDTIEDEGATISNVIDGLKEYGACTEPTWKFRESHVNDEPSQKAYDEGSEFLVESAQLVPVELDAWKTALAEGRPIIFGLELYNSFDKQRKKGLVPQPNAHEKSRGSHAGHAMLCVGYSDVDEVFIVRNSWGTDWGDKGYCYIPYSYMMNPDYNDGDCWIIEQMEALPHDEDTWSDDEESVLEEVSNVLADMSEEDYGELLENMDDYPFEQRLAMIFLAATSADGETSDEELEVIQDYLKPIQEIIGGNRQTARILKTARGLMDDSDLLDESIDLIWENFDYDVLASITSHLEEAASADGLAKAENRFINDLITRWQQDADDEQMQMFARD